ITADERPRRSGAERAEDGVLAVGRHVHGGRVGRAAGDDTELRGRDGQPIGISYESGDGVALLERLCKQLPAGEARGPEYEQSSPHAHGVVELALLREPPTKLRTTCAVQTRVAGQVGGVVSHDRRPARWSSVKCASSGSDFPFGGGQPDAGG